MLIGLEKLLNQLAPNRVHIFVETPGSVYSFVIQSLQIAIGCLTHEFRFFL